MRCVSRLALSVRDYVPDQSTYCVLLGLQQKRGQIVVEAAADRLAQLLVEVAASNVDDLLCHLQPESSPAT